MLSCWSLCREAHRVYSNLNGPTYSSTAAATTARNNYLGSPGSPQLAVFAVQESPEANSNQTQQQRQRRQGETAAALPAAAAAGPQQVLSFWHDIPLALSRQRYPTSSASSGRNESDDDGRGVYYVWAVSEVPRGTRAKYETLTVSRRRYVDGAGSSGGDDANATTAGEMAAAGAVGARWAEDEIAGNPIMHSLHKAGGRPGTEGTPR